MDFKREKKRNNYRIFIYAIFAIIIYVSISNIGKIFHNITLFFNVIKPIILGFIIGYLLHFPAKKIETVLIKVFDKNKEDKKKSEILKTSFRIISIVIVYCILIGLIYIAATQIIPFFFNSAIEIIKNMPGYVNSAEEWFYGETQKRQWLSNINAHELFNKIKSLNILSEAKRLVNRENIYNNITKVFSVANATANIFVMLIISINVIFYRDEIFNSLIRIVGSLVKSDKKEKFLKFTKIVNNVFINFFVGQGIDAIIVGVLASIVLLIMKVKYAIVLGALIGFTNLIPYVGAIIGIGVAGLITFFSGGFNQSILMIVIVTVLQQIDANIINPKILGDTLDINPILIIVSIIIGGKYFGGLGVFLAAPVITVIKFLIDDAILNREINKKKQLLINPKKVIKINKKELLKKKEKKYIYDIKINYIQKNYEKIKKEDEIIKKLKDDNAKIRKIVGIKNKKNKKGN